MVVENKCLVVVVLGVIWEVFALVKDFREVMLTSPPELAHCGGGGTVGQEVCITSQGLKI